MAFKGEPIRVLVIPGLRDSGPSHWQTWLQSHFRGSVRVEQHDWDTPDLPRWSRRIAETIDRDPGARWVAVAHSFGCLALAHHLAVQFTIGQPGIEAALLVAPADPDKFGVAHQLPTAAWPIPSVLVASDTDPWMAAPHARTWAHKWRTNFINLGDVGHINTESGFGPFPQAKLLTESLVRKLQKSRRIERAHPLEFSFAV
jgi:predicted alpha/beta hydrolase family esterase